MVVVTDINTYRDGGSLEIELKTFPNPRDRKNQENITIDFSIGTKKEEMGEWYWGWKNKGGIKITDSEFKAQVIREVEKLIKWNTIALDKVKQSKL